MTWRWSGNAALCLVGGWGAAALTLPEARRPALAVAGLGAIAVVLALVTGWRVVGSLAVALCAAAPLLGGAIEEDAAATGRLLAAALLVLLLVVGLDGVERRYGPEPVVLERSPLLRRTLAPLLALGCCAVVASVATAAATPSVALVLLGLAAAVGALLAATREH